MTHFSFLPSARKLLKVEISSTLHTWNCINTENYPWIADQHKTVSPANYETHLQSEDPTKRSLGCHFHNFLHQRLVKTVRQIWIKEQVLARTYHYSFLAMLSNLQMQLKMLAKEWSIGKRVSLTTLFHACFPTALEGLPTKCNLLLQTSLQRYENYSANFEKYCSSPNCLFAVFNIWDSSQELEEISDQWRCPFNLRTFNPELQPSPAHMRLEIHHSSLPLGRSSNNSSGRTNYFENRYHHESLLQHRKNHGCITTKIRTHQQTSGWRRSNTARFSDTQSW